MKYVRYPLFAEGYINRFLTTGIFTKEQQFKKAVLKGKVNEWLQKGFSIHENPCRQEFTAKRRNDVPPYLDMSEYTAGENITLFGQENFLNLYVPFGNVRMETSGFYYTPTFLRSYSYTLLEADEEATAEFELMTCGGLTLWVNGQLITDFTPFTRNMVKHTQVSVLLKKGINQLLICLDDLAERDTDYYFSIRKINQSPLSVLVPVSDQTDPNILYCMERMLEQIYFEKEAYCSETVALQMHNYLTFPIEFEMIITPGEFIEKMQNQEELTNRRSYCLEPEQKTVKLLHSDEMRPGYYYFIVVLKHNNITMKRKIGNQLVREDFLEIQEHDLQKRKADCIDTILDYGVDNVYKAALLLHKKEKVDKAQGIIWSEIKGVKARKDCSDFHFIIILFIYRTYHNLLSSQLKEEIEETAVNYRYWIDEPGDDVMWFFSENHALLFHTCQYLSGSYFTNRIFKNSGKTGAKQKKDAMNLLNQWFENFFKEFITEWNSSAYIPVDILGLGTLYQLTEKESELHEKAKRALDLIFFSLCINEHKGAVMTSFGRTYEKEIKGAYNAGTTSLLHLNYQTGIKNRASIALISLILSDYEAPAKYKAYTRLTGNKELIHQNTQGFSQHVNLYLYKNTDVLLSTAVGFKPNAKGYQEHIVSAVIDETAQVFINHPGESHPYGSGRPNFWAGNGILPMAMQFENTAVIKFDINPSHRIDYTHAYIPLSEFSQYRGNTHAIVLEKDGGYIGVKAFNGLEIQEMGPCRHREFISRGRQNVWVIKVARNKDYENLEAFLQTFCQINIDMNEDKEVTVSENENTTYFIDRKNICYRNGTKMYQYPLDVKGILQIKGE